jgi:hypothetical protein
MYGSPVDLQDADANVTFHVLFGIMPGQLALTPCPSSTSTSGCAAYALDAQVSERGSPVLGLLLISSVVLWRFCESDVLVTVTVVF